MEGLLVIATPLLLAGFALLMDRFEGRILAQPEMIETDVSAPEGADK